MADTKISALAAASAVVDANEFAINEAGTSKKVTAAQVKDYATAWFVRANVDRTLPNNTNLNAIFNSPTNGRFTLPAGVYRFEGLMIVTAMSATSGNALLNILGAGTATISDWMWKVMGLDNTTPSTIADDDSAYFQTNASAASAVVAGTGTALRASYWGMFNCTIGGTLIPSIDLVTAAACVLEEGSYFLIERLAAASAVSFGPVD